MEKDIVYAPYGSEEGLKARVEMLGAGAFGGWAPTQPRPEEAAHV